MAESPSIMLSTTPSQNENLCYNMIRILNFMALTHDGWRGVPCLSHLSIYRCVVSSMRILCGRPNMSASHSWLWNPCLPVRPRYRGSDTGQGVSWSAGLAGWRPRTRCRPAAVFDAIRGYRAIVRALPPHDAGSEMVKNRWCAWFRTSLKTGPAPALTSLG